MYTIILIVCHCKGCTYAAQGLAKRGNIVAETMLQKQMFLCLAAWETMFPHLAMG